jgi:hypothetical protein
MIAASSARTVTSKVPAPRGVPLVREALRQRELSQTTTITNVDFTARPASPLEDDRHALSGQWMEGMGDNQRVEISLYPRSSMLSPW